MTPSDQRMNLHQFIPVLSQSLPFSLHFRMKEVLMPYCTDSFIGWLKTLWNIQHNWATKENFYFQISSNV